MPDEKKDQNQINYFSILNEIKTSKAKNTTNNISSIKDSLNSFIYKMSQVKDYLVKEAEAKLQQEQELQNKVIVEEVVVEKDIEVKEPEDIKEEVKEEPIVEDKVEKEIVDTPVVEEKSEPVETASIVEEKITKEEVKTQTEEIPQQKPDQKKPEKQPKKEEPKKLELIPTDNPNIFLDPVTKRKIYVEQKVAKPEPKKQTVWVKPVSGNGQRPNNQKNPQNGFNRQQGNNQNGPKQGSAGYVAPSIVPTKPNKNQKGQPIVKTDDKGNKYDDTIKKGNKKGAFDQYSVEYDENGEEFIREGGRKAKGVKTVEKKQTIEITNAVITTDPVPVKTLSEKIGKTAAEIVKILFKIGVMKTINDSIDFATAELVAGEFNITLEYKPEVTLEQTLSSILEDTEVDDLDKLVTRPPVVTIMGHVDHGKTSLLDYIRNANVTSGEAGGITQHIGAYTVTLNGQKITFLDTPGHEAFTAMRSRGAMVTDIAILVVAADDGIMPQTIESISHAKLAQVPIIVALNKMDKPTANPDRVLSQLAEQGVTPEEWGGDTPVVRVSAKTGMGVKDLLEQILVRAEFQELKANPDRKAKGSIIEARLDKGLGKIATILVQNGTLNVGDYVVAGTCTGRIRAMIDDKGRKVKKAGPSIPVSVTGWDDIPEAGDRLDVVENEKFAKDLAAERQLKLEASKQTSTSVSLNDLFDKISKGELKSVKLIVKADVQGSVEAVNQSLLKLGNDEVSIDIIHSAVGGIKESDVLLAETAGAIIIGFNVRPDVNAKALAAQKNIDIRFYNIIYNAIEDIQKAVKGLLDPTFKEVVLGEAEVRELFRISGVGMIAGCHVIDGKVQKGAQARIIRNDKVEYTGEIGSLRHGKDDVKEMAKNFDCGIMLTNYQDMKVGDIIEAYIMEQIKDED